MRNFGIRRSLLWFLGIIIGNVLLISVAYFLQNHVPHAYGMPASVQTSSVVLSAMIFAIAGVVGGVAVKKAYVNAGVIESVMIGLPFPMLVAVLQRRILITEVTPLGVICAFTVMGTIGAYCGILSAKKLSKSI